MSTAASPWRWLSTAAILVAVLMLLASPAQAESSASKKELVARVLKLQMAGIESIAQALVERPAALLLQDASQAIRKRIAADQQETAGRRIQNSVKKYVDETAPLVRARAIKLAPTVLGAELESRFSEAELVQLLAWLESPISKKYQQVMPEIQDGFVNKLVADSRPDVDPKLLALEQDIRNALGLPAPPAAAAKSKAKTETPAAAESTPKSR